MPYIDPDSWDSEHEQRKRDKKHKSILSEIKTISQTNEKL